MAMLVAELIEVAKMVATGVVTINALVVIAIITTLVSGNHSKIAKHRRAPLDHDGLLMLILSIVAAVTAIGIYGLMGGNGGLTSMMMVFVGCGFMGSSITLHYSKALNRFYYRRAKKNLESDRIDEAMEDIAEVMRSTESLKSEATYLQAACFYRLGHIAQIESLLFREGFLPDDIPVVLAQIELDYPVTKLAPSKASAPDTFSSDSAVTDRASLDLQQTNSMQTVELPIEVEFNHLRAAVPRQPYRLSGRVSMVKLSMLAPIMIVATAITGGAATLAMIHSPSVKLNLLIPVLAAMLIGWIGYRTVRLGHVRSRLIGCVVTASLGMAAWYAGWMTHYVYYAIAMAGQPGAMPIGLPTPMAMVGWMTWVYENGVVAIQGNGNFSGDMAATAWLAEWLTLVIGSASITYMKLADAMYCDDCGCWMVRDDHGVSLPTRHSDNAIRRLKGGDLAAIMKMSVDADTRDRLAMKLCVCPRCTDSRCLEITETTQKADNGKMVDVEKRIVGPIPISADEERELRALSRQLTDLSQELAAARVWKTQMHV